MNKDLLQIKEYLENNKDFNVDYGKEGRDERISSNIQEEYIIDAISKEFKIKKPNARHWYDFSYKDKYVNIKITDPKKNASDNLSSKKGLYLALTGEEYNETNDWGTFFKKLAENIKESDKDYYFLVFFKGEKEILLTSLRSLEVLTPNGNNLPFQANWSKNKKIINRNFDEASKFLLTNLYESVKLRSEIRREFECTALTNYI